MIYTSVPTSFKTGWTISSVQSPKGNMMHFKKKLNSDIQTAASIGTSQIILNPALLDLCHEYKETKDFNNQQ